ncbi:putative hydrolases of HD superfamily [Gemmobacter megaterium]|uniref:Putative hydrolases of HD superfamily n=1 Tax=Gemmobacter megaterium TaxID=1086013 RepID=A0A1N7KRL7_9RHOB|nr:HD domain-containing protein [Gemmobacter megaterium]GGE03472.1 hydrolase [Gemmobacter megaterium]SIS64201.1 putative hydrolases of HD superfamily [Gemmobacter megaterium]
MTDPARLAAQLAFLTEADKLKSVLRAGTLADRSRRENSGEHSWHVALFAMVLADQAADGVDIARVIRMLLIHDLVEIDTGDTPIHANDGQSHGSAGLLAQERAAADRLFGLLPSDQAAEFRALWEEFEAAETPDAVFAKSLDRVQPVMQNLASDGGTWVEYAVTRDQLETRVGHRVARGAPGIWAHLAPLLDRWFTSR